MYDRRSFVGAMATAAIATSGAPLLHAATPPRRTFKVWVFSDPHVGTDIRFRRESLGEAIRQSEFGESKVKWGRGGDPFDWDIALALGDFSGANGTPTDEEGKEIVRQFGFLKKHKREDIYTIAGNHDATPYTEETQWWFRKWIDPMGEHPEFSNVHRDKMKYPVVGTWERYYFRVGNILFLMMSDRNDLPPPVGRNPQDNGGYPAGAITMDTYQWWRDMIQTNPDDIIVSSHHHMIKNTTTASGPWQGFARNEDGTIHNLYHGYFPNEAPQGASYLYYIDGKPDTGLIEDYLQKNPGKLDMWLGGHTHLYPTIFPGEKEYLERKWGTTFINCSPLAKYHVERPPSSRLITFEEGSDKARVQFYLHSNDFYFQGWFHPLERIVPLSKKFKLS